MLRVLGIVLVCMALMACGGDDNNTSGNTTDRGASDGATANPSADGDGDSASDGMSEDASQPTAAVRSPVLRFSAIPSEKDATGYRAKFAKVSAYLSKTLDIPVEYVHASSYSSSVKSFQNGYIHLAWFGGLTGVQARHLVSGATAIAQGKEDPDYYSYFIASADSGLEKGDSFPMGMKGKKFTFGSESSTSGRLMPEYFVRKYGKNKPAKFFDQIAFSGAHNLTALQVQSGQFDCGALSYKTYDKMVAKGEIDPAKCKVIWKSDTYPDYNFTAHPDLEKDYGEGFTKKLQTALIGMKGADLLDEPFGRSAMIPATNEDFAPIHKLALELGFIE